MPMSDEESQPRLPSDSDDEPRILAKSAPKPEESSDDSSDCGVRLPSVDQVFDLVEKRGLSFAKYGQKIPPAVPTVSNEPVIVKEAETAPQVRPRSRSPQAKAGGEKVEKGKGKDKMSVKDRTKLKRMKGQSGEDHAGRTWKPEEWMKLRQDYD